MPGGTVRLWPPVRVCAAVAVSAALVVSACSSGTKTLSKAEFIKQADAICKSTTDQVAKLPAPSSSSSVTDIESTVQQAVNLVDPALTKIQALKGPAAEERILAVNFMAPNRAQSAAAHGFLTAVKDAKGDAAKQQDALAKFGPALTDPQQEQHDKAMTDAGFVECGRTN